MGRDAAGKYGLWVTNGTAAGTHEVTGISGAYAGGVLARPDLRGSLTPDFTVLNGQVVFPGTDASGVVGLWVTDGTAGGTHEPTGIPGTIPIWGPSSFTLLGSPPIIINTSHSVLTGIISEINSHSGTGARDHAAGKVLFTDTNTNGTPFTVSIVHRSFVYRDANGNALPLPADSLPSDQGEVAAVENVFTAKLSTVNPGDVDWTYNIANGDLRFHT